MPINSPPLEDGEIVVRDDQILEVRKTLPGRQAGNETIDLGAVILLPGLVNVHTHLDYTVMRGLLEDLPFFPWVRELTARKERLNQIDWEASATIGAAEAVASGVTTLGDCTSTGAALTGAKRLGLRGIIYQEVFGIDPAVNPEHTLIEFKVKVEALRREAINSQLEVGISPHSPYTVNERLFKLLADYIHDESPAVCIHAAESTAEAELLRTGSGAISDMFVRRSIEWHAPGVSPITWLDMLGIVGPRTLIVHAVQLSMPDRAIVGNRGASFAHCPKSNAKLGNGIAPYGLMKSCFPDGQARIGLGSDSVASNNVMDLFEEMRFALLIQRARGRRVEAMTAPEALEMATLGGARALGMESRIGTLEAGKFADIIAVRCDSLHMLPGLDPVASLVYSAGAADVCATIIAGELRYHFGNFVGYDPMLEHNNFLTAARRLRLD